MYVMMIHESHVFELRNFDTKFYVCDPRIFPPRFCFCFECVCVCVCVCVYAFQPVIPPDKLFKYMHMEFPLIS